MADAPLALHPAATVVLLRPAAARAGAGVEVLLLRRRSDARFMPGAWVFPGGRLDEADRRAGPEACHGLAQARAAMPGLTPGEAVGYHVAAARELFEEAGVLLACDASGVPIAGVAPTRLARLRSRLREVPASFAAAVGQAGWRLALDRLAPFAHWVTPEHEASRYDTRFFLALLPAGQQAAHEEGETPESAWMAPGDALQRAERDEIVLPPPTWRTLRDLQHLPGAPEALDWARRQRVVRRMARFIWKGGLKLLVLPGDPLYPAPPGEAMTGETRFVLTRGVWKAQQAGSRPDGSPEL